MARRERQTARGILRRALMCGVVLPMMCAGTTASAADAGDVGALMDLSIEELMSIKVTSVSKRPEALLSAPAAIRVVTSEDIRRSGADTIPAALRLAGNLDVAQENAHEWVISARGFSSDVGNKLLVMVDGRTVYTPLFSGVFWDRQDYVLEDIDRIEIVSGPGGALWGANAVNGVINITTRNARDTQGLYLEAATGTEQNASAVARYGATTEGGIAYRVFGKYSDYDSTVHPLLASSDDWRVGHLGFRA